MPSRLFSVNIGGSGGGSGVLVQRSGNTTVAGSSNTATIVFSSAMANTNYAIEYSINNSVDPTPIMLQGIVTAKTVNGFTITFNTATDTANYSIDYGAQTYV